MRICHRQLLRLVVLMVTAAAVCACDVEAPSGDAPATVDVAAAGPVSSALVVSRDGKYVVIAAEDHDQLLVVRRSDMKLLRRIEVGDAPNHVIALSDGRFAVSLRYAAAVAVVDIDSETVQRIAVGAEPFGLAEVRPGVVVVTLAGEAAVAEVDLAAQSVTQKVQLQVSDPRAVAVMVDGAVFVTHMSAGGVSRVSLENGTSSVVNVETASSFSSQRLHAEHLRSLTVDPTSGTLLMAHTQANSDVVRAPIGSPTEEPAPGTCGYGGCASELGAVVPAVTELDPETGTLVLTATSGGSPMVDPVADCIDCGGGAPSFVPANVLNPADARFAGIAQHNPAAVAVVADGQAQLVVYLGTKNALLLRRQLTGAADDVLAEVRLGNGAQSLALSPDGRTAYVWNQFDASLSSIRIPDLERVQSQQRGVDSAGRAVVVEGPVQLAAFTQVLVDDALSAPVSLGRKLFHDATNVEVAKNATVSCATCHPDGRHDGQTWQFVFGPRNTPSLGGGILDTAPFHWPGDVPTVSDLNAMTVLPFMGGAGLPAESFDLVAAYIDSIRAAPASFEARADISEAELRGEAIFESEAAGCIACHVGAHLTDNIGYDVGSQAAAHDIRVFQTPVLHSLERTAPYLHDGSAATLEEMVERLVRADKMGKGSHLSDEDVADLVAYLKTL